MSRVQTVIVGEDEGDQRLDRWFKKRFPHIPRGCYDGVPQRQRPWCIGASVMSHRVA